MVTQNENYSESKPMTTSEAAEYLGVSMPTIYRYIHLRTVPHYKPKKSRRVFFKKSELDAFMLDGRVASADELDSKAADYLVQGRK